MNFANLFKDLRKDLQFTQAQMAKALNLSQSALCKIEAGKLEPSARTFIGGYRMACEISKDGMHKEWDAALNHWSLRGKK